MLIPEVWRTALQVDSVMRSLNANYCVIGGVALQRWGEPRVTRDVDLTIFVGFQNERVWIEQLSKAFRPRIEDHVNFALLNRILLLQDEGGIGIDISLASFDFEQRLLERASEWGPNFREQIRTCSAEDLVTLKAFADRPQDWIDVEKVIIRQSDRLDRELIVKELEVLVALKEEPQILERLTKIFHAYRSDSL